MFVISPQNANTVYSAIFTLHYEIVIMRLFKVIYKLNLGGMFNSPTFKFK